MSKSDLNEQAWLDQDIFIYYKSPQHLRLELRTNPQQMVAVAAHAAGVPAFLFGTENRAIFLLSVKSIYIR